MLITIEKWFITLSKWFIIPRKSFITHPKWFITHHHELPNRIPLFCFVTLVFWFSMYTCVPILTAYLKDLGVSNRMAGLIVGMYGLSQMPLRIPVGVRPLS